MTPAPRRWHLLVDPVGRRGADNMGIDAALLRAAREGDAFLRLYRWEPGCLSFGRHEPARTRYDRARIRALALDTVRRPTGGRAVWHADEVTYAVAAPLDTFGSLQTTYHTVHELIAAALRSLNVDAVVASRGPTAHIGAGACFATAIGGEVVIEGRKLVGSAQVRHRGAFLQHGSILLRDDQHVVARVTRGPSPEPASIGLGTVLGRRVTFDEVATAIVREAQHAWPGAWDPDARPPAPDPRFGDPDWTWRR